MMMLKLLPLLAMLGVMKAQQGPDPQQIHLSMTGDPTQMMITWVTFVSTNESVVEYVAGKGSIFNKKAVGTEKLFVDGGSLHRHIYNHRVLLQGLTPGQMYSYHVGNKLAWSELFFFYAVKDGSDWSPRFAVYGDLGNANARSLPYLQEEVQQQKLDFVLHIGDFAYDMDTKNATFADTFMRQIQPVAAYIPYMACPGNHEQKYNFSNYKARFTVPGGDGFSQFYSFNVGPMHIISISTEFYYFVQYGWKQIEHQYNWLVKDLQEANTPANRAKHPWIVVVGHRPMYCSNLYDYQHCSLVNNLIRVGIPLGGDYYMFGLEDLFYKHGVDLIFGAHEHSYERMWPVYNRFVCNGSDPANPYNNPPGPVHLVTGSAGCSEGVAPFKAIPNPWSAKRSDDYGYTIMQAVNATHMTMQQVSVNKDLRVVDSITYIRDNHGPGVFNCVNKTMEQDSTNTDLKYHPRNFAKPPEAGAKKSRNDMK